MTGTLSLARSPDRWVTAMDGARLRQLRRQRGLSAAELATKAGIGLSTEIQLERQPQHSCRTRTLARLAAALGQPPTDLIADRLPGLRSRDSAMKWQTEMQLRSSGLLDDRRFDALANALAELDEADPEVEDTDLTASLADGGVSWRWSSQPTIRRMRSGGRSLLRGRLSSQSGTLLMAGSKLPAWLP